MGSSELERRLRDTEARLLALTEALRQAEARAAALYEHAPDPILEVDAAGRIVTSNATARHRLPDALPGRPLRAVFAPPGDALVERAFGAGLDDSFDGELRLANGRVVLLRAVPLPTRGAVVALRDVSERVALREQLEQGRRDAALGRIAGGIAHEINNPLTVLQLRTDLLFEDARVPRDLRRQIDLVRESTRRIARIVRSLQQVARPPEAVESVHVGELVERTVGATRAHVTTEVALEVVIDPLLHVRGDPGSLALAIEHLVLAAAADGPAEVRVRATDERVSIAVSTPAGTWPDDVVADPSAPLEVPVGGLGIAIAGTVARDHGGEVRIAARPGGGGVLTLHLPRAVTVRTTPALPPGRVRPARVLVVDDEPLVASVIVDWCRRAGHAVEVAPSAEDAMRRLDAEPSFDVVIADDRLPGTSGRQLVAWVIRRRPELAQRVALMSGGAREPDDPPFLPKPFTRHQLQELMDALLGR